MTQLPREEQARKDAQDMTLRSALAHDISRRWEKSPNVRKSGRAIALSAEEVEFLLACLAAPAQTITNAQGVEWFERTFGVPIGDKPGQRDAERVKAGSAQSPAAPANADALREALEKLRAFDHWSLVIDSCVRHSDAPHSRQVADLLKRNRVFLASWGDTDAAPANADVLREALTKLYKEVSGVWRVYEPDLRAAMGHTNYAVVGHHLENAEHALASHSSERGTQPLGFETVTIPKWILSWLFGEGPDLEGNWFGDGLRETAKYWWRTPLRKMIGWSQEESCHPKK